MDPTVPEDYSSEKLFPEALPPEIQHLLKQHPGWGLFPLRDASAGGPGLMRSPPFLGPLHAVPSSEELESRTELRHHYHARLLRLQNEADLQEFLRIFQGCADGHYALEFCTYRWDEQGLWFFICYDVPVRTERAPRKPVLPVSPF